jgi:hypothetical protein
MVVAKRNMRYLKKKQKIAIVLQKYAWMKLAKLRLRKLQILKLKRVQRQRFLQGNLQALP